MYVLVIGGGRKGMHLIRSLLGKGYEVGLIEKDPSKCNFLHETFNILVVNGDGTDEGILRAASAESASYTVTVTDSDEENLAICQVLGERLGLGRIIAYVDNPTNQRLFRILGVIRTVSPAALIHDMMEGE